jgi:methionyl-tRNA formyltransferase
MLRTTWFRQAAEMRIYFIGTTQYSRALLEKSIKSGFSVVGVATKHDTGFNADYADLSAVCATHGISCDTVTDINAPNQVRRIRDLAPDVIFCFGWNRLLKDPLLSVPPLGCVGHHPAALPRNRGRHPLIWAIVLGLEKTASTFFYLDPGVDSGDIISQVFFPIHYEDSACTVYERMTEIALRQIEDFVPKLASGTVMRIPQDLTQANYWRKRGLLDGQIDFRMDSRRIYDLVRGLTRPFVGAHCVYKSTLVKVWKAREVNEPISGNLEPGKILDVTGGMIRVKTFGGAIELLEHEFSVLPVPGEYL